MSRTKVQSKAITGSRLDVRIPLAVKELIESAAIAKSQTITEFTISTLTNAAEQILQSERSTKLSNNDRELFLDLLEVKTRPNDALKQAARRYQREVRS